MDDEVEHLTRMVRAAEPHNLIRALHRGHPEMDWPDGGNMHEKETAEDRNEIEWMTSLFRSAKPLNLVRALHRVHPDMDWPGRKPRPRIPIDLAKLEKLGAHLLTVGEAAWFFDVSRSTLTRRLREPAYRLAWERGRDKTRRAIRRAQLEVALEDKDRTMLIWLGKQMLGQSDNPVAEPVRVAQPDQPPTISVEDFDRELEEIAVRLSCPET